MPLTDFNDSAFLSNLGNSILESVSDALVCKSLDVPQRRFVGFNRPAQDCCPDLVLWFGNIRVWDGDFPDTRTAGNLLCANGYSIDATVRIGLCYVDFDADGGPLDAQTIGDFSANLNAYGTALYMGWINQWRAGNVEELVSCDLVNVGPMTPYYEGGCAGWEFTITVGVM